MNAEGLRAAEAEIRSTLVGSSLEWVLDEVDLAIAAGIPEEKVLRNRSQRVGATTGLDADASQFETVDRIKLPNKEIEASRKRGTLVIATRPMTDRERVHLLLEALRRVLVELPDIEAETLALLGTIPAADEGEREEIEGVVFEPDDTPRNRPRRSMELGSRIPDARRERLDELFTRADGEVRA